MRTAIERIHLSLWGQLHYLKNTPGMVLTGLTSVCIGLNGIVMYTWNTAESSRLGFERLTQNIYKNLDFSRMGFFETCAAVQSFFIRFAETNINWTASSEFGTYSLCEQRRFRRACASAQSRQNLRCSLIQAVSQEEPSDRKTDPWPLWMAGHAQLKFVMTECSKTQIRLTGLIWWKCPWKVDSKQWLYIVDSITGICIVMFLVTIL